MKHIRAMGRLPQHAQGEGLCDNITTTTQARYCFVPLVQPFILWKTTQDGDETATGA